MSADRNYSDELLTSILTSVKSIALVGASDKENRPSYEVMEFLLNRGFQVTPINPRLADSSIHGKTVVADLDSLSEKVDMVEIFLNPALVAPVVDEAIRIGAKVIWMQIGVIDESAAEKAEKAGITVIMDRCPKREIPRLGL